MTDPAVPPRRRPRSAVLAGLLAAAAVGSTAAAPPPASVDLEPLGTHESGSFDEGGAEIVRYDRAGKRVFAVNAAAASVDVIGVANPASPVLVASIDVAAALGADPAFTGSVGGVNSLAVQRGILAVAVEADPKTDPGWAAFFRADTLELVSWVEAGALPDMITFSPGGRLVLVANEGEPNSYGEIDSVDPRGSVTVIRPRAGFRNLDVFTLDFTGWDGQEEDLRAAGIRIFGPGSTASQDLEPEYIAVTADGRRAYVTLQENNAVAVLDLQGMAVDRLIPLGWKDHSIDGNGLDGSDRDGAGSSGAIRIDTWPVRGLHMPDGIAVYTVGGVDYFVTANEGDSREDWFEEEARVKDLALDPAAFPDAADLKNDDFIGRLTVTTTLGDTDDDGDFDALYSFGARSFSIWDQDGNRVFDSGDQFEQRIADLFPAHFNSDHAANNFDNRSDNKGPEPEGVALGRIRGRTCAFVGLERIGGVMVYDVTDPFDPFFVEYRNPRDFGGDPEGGTAGDLGPEGIDFEARGPRGKPILVVGNEVSGT
ncbi:MAG: choice-of-anchor I family protein, partial [Planctomycetes bacterium]|nr:choice-of-anchor I family protein [Planctomycetota bacterium]